MPFFGFPRRNASKKKKAMKRLGIAERFLLNWAYSKNRKKYASNFKIDKKYEQDIRNAIASSTVPVARGRGVYDVFDYPLIINSKLSKGIHKSCTKSSKPFKSISIVFKRDKYVVCRSAAEETSTSSYAGNSVTDLTIAALMRDVNRNLYSIKRSITPDSSKRHADEEYSLLKTWLNFMFQNKFEYAGFKTDDEDGEGGGDVVCRLSFAKSNMDKRITCAPGLVYDLLEEDYVNGLYFYDQNTLPIELFKTMDINSNKINDLYCIIELKTALINEAEYYTNYIQ